MFTENVDTKLQFQRAKILSFNLAIDKINLANDGADYIEQDWIAFEKSISNVLASLFI